LKAFLHILILFASGIVLIQNSYLEVNLGYGYYALFFGILCLLLLAGNNFRFNIFVFSLVVACYVSILFNDIPDFFLPKKRFAAFLMVIGLVGPLLKNDLLIFFRQRLFNVLNIAIVFMVIVSFITIVAGLSFTVNRSGISGLFAHSMTMGPMAAIAAIVCIDWSCTQNTKTGVCFFRGLAITAFIACVASGSRSALLGGILGVSFFLFKTSRKNPILYILNIALIAGCSFISFPLWKSFSGGLIEKMEYAEDQGDIFASRTYFWEARLREFESSPLIGVGFASVDPTLSETNAFDSTNGRVEPGSSWLAVLSMTGLAGFIPLVSLLLLQIANLLRRQTNSSDDTLYGALLFFFIVHMFAEGYIFSAGSGLFFYFWLLLGKIDASNYFDSNINKSENENRILCC